MSTPHTLSHDVLLELMAYADGELDDDARERIEAFLATSEDARAVVTAMDPLGEFVRTSADVGASAADGIASAVMARIDADDVALANDAASARPAETNVISLERARAARAARLRVVGAAAGVAALAAAYFLVARPAQGPSGSDGVVASTTPSALTARASAFPETPPPAQLAIVLPGEGDNGTGVEVEHVDAPNNDVSVIYVPAVATPDVNASSVVIWINDDKAAGGL